MWIEVSWGEVKMEDLGYILEVESVGLADELAMEGHKGKVKSRMTHEFSAHTTE